MYDNIVVQLIQVVIIHSIYIFIYELKPVRQDIIIIILIITKNIKFNTKRLLLIVYKFLMVTNSWFKALNKLLGISFIYLYWISYSSRQITEEWVMNSPESSITQK